MRTLLDLIDELPRLGNRRAVGLRGEHGTRWWTYRELHAMVHRAAGVLARHDLRAGQRVLLHAPNSPEWVAFFLGAALRGIIVVPVDASAPAARVLEIARLTDAVFLIDESKDPLIGIPRHGIEDLSGAEPAVERAPLTPSDPAVILFTSGSTGSPRGVVLTHANLLHQVAPFLRLRTPLRLLRFRLLALSPLSHVQGLILGLCIPFAIGLIVLYTTSLQPEHLIRTIRAARIRFLSTVPRVLDLLERELRTRVGPQGNPLLMARVMGRRFRVLFVGGATLPAEREAFWRSSAIAVMQGYGMTETSALATINLPFLGRAGSIGLALHHDSVRIADDGEILVRGPHVATSFIGDEAEAFTEDGYLRTGDIARRDARNRLFFLGRKKEVLVTAEGHNVHPSTLETRLLANAGVRDAVVLGMPRDGFEEVHAVLLLDSAADAPAVMQSTNIQLASHERIRSWTVWPEADFPRGVLSKANRVEIARRLAMQSGENHASCDVESLDACIGDPDPGRRVRRLVAYFSAQAAHADAEQLMRDSGADSIDILQVLSRVKMPDGALPLTPDTQSPSWPFTPGLSFLRSLLRRAFLDPLLAMNTSVRASGTEHLASVNGPSLFALVGKERLDRLDYLRVYRGLPSRFRRRLMFVTATTPLFATYAKPDEQSLWYRIRGVLFFRLVLPLLMPFTLFPTPTQRGTAEGLRRACVWIDRGFTPLSTWGRGTAIMAAECGLTVVPVRMQIEPNGVTIAFRPPVLPHPARSSDELHALVTQS